MLTLSSEWIFIPMRDNGISIYRQYGSAYISELWREVYSLVIECIDITENERVRTQCRLVSENLCVTQYACLHIEIYFFKLSCEHSDKQTKLCLHIMNRHKFLMICMLKYHLEFWCLIIYKPFYPATLYCYTRYYFLKHFFVTNSDQLKKNFAGRYC